MRMSTYQMRAATLLIHVSLQGSNVYEVNIWLWQFGRGRPMIGGRDVAETERRREVRMEIRQRNGWETKKRRKAAREADAGGK